tara:strand:- start:68 stop:361 length:294 start_codon:yes stop_codon:yes gene_type:complete
MAVQRLLHVVSLQPFSAVSFTFIAMFKNKIPTYDKNMFSAGNIPPLGSPNNRQFYVTGAVGSIIGNLTQVGAKTVARMWSNGKQTRINGRNDQFNIF